MSANSEKIGGVPERTTPVPEQRLTGLFAGHVAKSAAGAGRYSAFVGVMRYALPLSAVLLLGLIVIWPLASGREEGFRVTYSATEGQDGSLKMLNARYVGTDSQSQPFTVTAEEAIPSAADAMVITLKNLTADMFMEGDSWAAVTAREGLYNRTLATLDLAGDVTVYSDQGHELHTESAHLKIQAGEAEGHEAVSGQGPLGLINGSAFRITDRGANVFVSGPVKTTIFSKRPDNQPEARP